MVERPPPRPLVDEYGMEIEPIPEHEAPSPSSPHPSPLDTKPAPRPYLSRSRSSSTTPSPVLPSLLPPALSALMQPDAALEEAGGRRSVSPAASPLSPVGRGGFGFRTRGSPDAP